MAVQYFGPAVRRLGGHLLDDMAVVQEIDAVGATTIVWPA
jgi:hypothetical protein